MDGRDFSRRDGRGQSGKYRGQSQKTNDEQRCNRGVFGGTKRDDRREFWASSKAEPPTARRSAVGGRRCSGYLRLVTWSQSVAPPPPTAAPMSAPFLPPISAPM